MPKFKVTATMDVGYTAIIEAENEEKAWAIARNGDEADWEQTDNGHDWTLENIREIEDDEVSQAANNDIEELASVSPSANFVECEQGQMGEGKNKLINQILDERIVEYAKANDPKPVPVQKHKPNPPRNPFTSETQNIRGYKK